MHDPIPVYECSTEDFAHPEWSHVSELPLQAIVAVFELL